eukprot:scaffold118933_cov37-Tisochrysis_lutea.AAC.2
MSCTIHPTRAVEASHRDRPLRLPLTSAPWLLHRQTAAGDPRASGGVPDNGSDASCKPSSKALQAQSRKVLIALVPSTPSEATAISKSSASPL